MSGRIVGRRKWGYTEDAEGYPTYTLTVRVQTASYLDGPNVAVSIPGLPRYGDPWSFGNDFSPWATCRHDRTVTEVVEQDGRFFDIDYSFRVKPDGKNCYEQTITDPLLQPMKQSGSFQRDKAQGLQDRFGQAIHTSSWEVITGPQNEWDCDRPQVIIQQFVPMLQLEAFAPMVDCLNDRPLWGLPKRCWKLSTSPWEVLYRGVCEKYYTRTFTFDGDRKTWDRDIQDEGTKCLRGHWHPKVDVWVLDRLPAGCAGAGQLPNRFNPASFVRVHDRNGNHMKVVLDGFGKPVVAENWTYTFQGSAAEVIKEAETVSGAYLGPYHTETQAQAACCLGDTSGTGGPARATLGTDTFLCMQGTGTAVPGDQNYWAKIDSDQLYTVEWDNDSTYGRGSIVFLPGGTDLYVALTRNSGIPPLSAGYATYWMLLSNPITNKGQWAVGSSYSVGDFVIGTGYTTYIALLPNLGNLLGDITAWATLQDGLTPAPWAINTSYEAGDLVTYGLGTYVAKAYNSGENPGRRVTNWIQLETGLTNRDAWLPATSYSIGDYVRQVTPAAGTVGTGTGSAEWWCITGLATQPGKIHVEYYRETNFLLLGIPVILG